MKRTIYICGTLIMAILFLVLQVTVHGKSERRNELSNTLNAVVEQTVDTLMNNKEYQISTYKEFIADFTQGLSVALDADSDIEVSVLKADIDKGLLSVKVTEIYKHPNGKTGKEECTKTVVFEKLIDHREVKSTYNVKFFRSKEDMDADKSCYKIYEITEGGALIQPTIVSDDEKIFDGWKDSNGNNADFSQPVTSSRSYYAAFL